MAVPFDTITATTLQLIRPRLADNIFKASNLIAYLLMRGRVQLARGGKYLQEPLMYATNQTVQSYRGYDKLNVAATDELTAAQYNWRQAAVSISYSGLEDLENDGPQQVFNVIRAKIQNAEMSLKQYFNEKALADTGTKDLTRDFLGLDELIENTAVAGPPGQSILGGIDRSVEQWWGNRFIDNSGDHWGTSTTKLTNHLTSGYNTVRRNHNVAVDLILTDQAVFERYENDNRTLMRLSDRRMMDLGFDNLRFKGSLMMWNEDVKNPGGDNHLVYFISTEFLRMILHARRNFVMSSFVSPYDQDARVAQILVAGQMTTNNSRFQGVMEESEVS